MRFVLDTSVLVAATRSASGASNLLLADALLREFELVISVPLLLEYEAVLKRAEQRRFSGLTLDEIDILVEQLVAAARLVHRRLFWRPLLRDVSDDLVLDAAFAGDADALVTHNIKHLQPTATDLGICLCTPGEALQLYGGSNEAK